VQIAGFQRTRSKIPPLAGGCAVGAMVMIFSARPLYSIEVKATCINRKLALPGLIIKQVGVEHRFITRAFRINNHAFLWYLWAPWT